MLNDIPEIEPMDIGIMKRLEYIEFPFVFVDKNIADVIADVIVGADGNKLRIFCFNADVCSLVNISSFLISSDENDLSKGIQGLSFL